MRLFVYKGEKHYVFFLCLKRGHGCTAGVISLKVEQLRSWGSSCRSLGGHFAILSSLSAQSAFRDAGDPLV
jgi:hypothetical protein